MGARAAAVLCCLASFVAAAPQAPPVVAGIVDRDLEPEVRGAVLLGELGCAVCHDAGPRQAWLMTKAAPRLDGVGARVAPAYLRAFLADPHGTKPGTTMPDVLASLVPDARAQVAEALTHYLVSRSAQVFAPTAPDRIAAQRGRTLFQEIGCVACHAPRDDAGGEVALPDSVPLGRLADKYSVASLAAFLRDPLQARPAGRMPKFALTPREELDLAHYLLAGVRVPGRLRTTLYLGGMDDGLDQLEGKEHSAGLADGFSLEPWREVRDELAVVFEGFLRVVTPGPTTFELTCDTESRLLLDGALVVTAAGGASEQATIDLGEGLHAIRLAYLHVRGERALRLRWSAGGEGLLPIAPALLQAERESVAPSPSWQLDRNKAARGAALFDELGCASCHEQVRPPSRAALAALDLARGCLSGTSGAWPDYALAAEQRSDLRAALAHATEPTPEQRIRQRLAALNCVACHTRGDFGGASAARNGYFLSEAVTLGEVGRVPPPLAGVGAKLRAGWLADTIAHGGAVRPYLKTRMPGFGMAHGAALEDLFKAQDHLPAAPITALPKEREAAKAITDLGRELSGSGGMQCITCHLFRGRGEPAMPAADLVETTTQRLEPAWFYHYMLQPARFRPGTLMPQFFVGGTSTRTEFVDGDATQQINALWHYLAQGRNTRAPKGLVRPSMELVVGDEAVILRRSVQNTGKRGISVGYPLGVHLTFDAESLGLNQIWWGRFLDPGGVWTGQGSGQARILGRERVALPKGPAFVELSDETAPWPTASRRELGQRFLGYELDAQRRPAFRYACAGVTVRDAAVDHDDPDRERPLLRRTLTFSSAVDMTLYFRAAVDKRIEQQNASTVRVGSSLLLRLPSGAFFVRSAGDAQELLVRIPITDGAASITVDYVFAEESR